QGSRPCLAHVESAPVLPRREAAPGRLRRFHGGSSRPSLLACECPPRRIAFGPLEPPPGGFARADHSSAARHPDRPSAVPLPRAHPLGERLRCARTGAHGVLGTTVLSLVREGSGDRGGPPVDRRPD